MAIAISLKQYLSENDISYDTLAHPYTLSSTKTAQASHIPGANIAKAVLLKEEDDYLLAVLPASRHISFDDIEAILDHEVRLATEEEVESLFCDCELGAIPPIGKAYGVDVLMDDSLTGKEDVYFEAGDHATLVHVNADQFGKMMESVRHGLFSLPD
ncbi:MAG: YbaK/EbsC family protein [Proteobacteria bacterium]|nr:YbaK/EbsC family protein [Pseudomonadota bacterium]